MSFSTADTLVVLPTYREAATLRGVVAGLLAGEPDVHVLIIDDASPDGTGDIADALAAQDPRVTVLHRARKLGLGTAYLQGFRRARELGYAWVVEMDVDGSHLVQDLGALRRAAREGAGLAIGTRWMPGGRVSRWPWYRRAISRVGTGVARLLLRSTLRDLTSGFRVISVDWLDRIHLSQLTAEGYGFQVELAWCLERAGCPIAEVPIHFVEREAGSSKMSVGIIREALWRVIRWGWLIRTGRLPKRRKDPGANS